MRLFTGLDLPGDVVANLEELLRRLRPAARIQWSPPANLHVTTKFIGEWPDEKLDQLKDQLRTVPPPGKIDIAIAGLGWFPNPHSPRIFWCGIQASDALPTLARDTDATLVGIGVPKETNPYSPHLTLARIAESGNLFPLKQAVSHLPSVDFGRFTAETFHLYLSKTGPKGSVYSVLDSYPLGNE